MSYDGMLVDSVETLVDEKLKDIPSIDAKTRERASKKAAVAVYEEVKGMPLPDGGTASRLWTILVGTLSVVVVLAVLGVGWTILDGNADTAPDVLVTIFTAALTGLIGLFVKPQS